MKSKRLLALFALTIGTRGAARLLPLPPKKVDKDNDLDVFVEKDVE